MKCKLMLLYLTGFAFIFSAAVQFGVFEIHIAPLLFSVIAAIMVGLLFLFIASPVDWKFPFNEMQIAAAFTISAALAQFLLSGAIGLLFKKNESTEWLALFTMLLCFLGEIVLFEKTNRHVHLL